MDSSAGLWTMSMVAWDTTITAVSRKLNGWEPKKSKTSWGGETVDFGKIGAATVQPMATADVRNFGISWRDPEPALSNEPLQILEFS